MSKVELTSELKAELVDIMGNELTIVNAARVSLNQHSDEFTEKDAGLISFLMRNRHASPFEHCTASFLISAPILVAREWHRHRTQSYNEVSGRYTEMKPLFYAPDLDRPLIQIGKPGAYHFEVPNDDQEYYRLWKTRREVAQFCWDAYQEELNRGIAKEVAREVLPINLYTGWYATANLRNWLGFLSLRTDKQAMHEIRMIAGQIETVLHKKFPTVLDAWDEFGRGSI